MKGTAKCSKCKESIRFIKTKSGKSMPVDNESVVIQLAAGKDIFITSSGEMIKGKNIFKGSHIDNHVVGKGFIIAYIPHWGSCSAIKSKSTNKKATNKISSNLQISMF